MARFPHFCKPILRYYWLILLVAVGMTWVGGSFARHLRLESDMAALLPESFVSVRELRRMEAEVVGGSSTLRVALKSQDFNALVEAADTLAQWLLESEYVGSVDYQNDVEFYETHALLFLPEAKLDSLHTAIQDAIDREKQALNPFMVDDLFGPPPGAEAAGEDEELARWEEEYSGELPSRYYLNPDSTVIVVSLNPAQGAVSLSYSRRMVADIKARVGEIDLTRFAPDMEVFYGSNIKNRVDEEAAIMSDVIGTAQYGISGVFLLIAIVFIVANAAGGITGIGSFLITSFRGVLAAVLVSLSLFMSLAWTFGLTYLMVKELNMITAFLIVILFGMGVDYGIHAMARYVESKQAGLDTAAAIDRMVCKTGSALATTAFTTSAAFFSLMLLQFKGFSELGLITGVGMIFAFIAMVVVLPSMVVLAEKIGIMDVPQIPGREVHAVKSHFPAAKGIIVASVVLTVIGIGLFTQVRFQYDFTNLRIITQEREEYSRETSGVFSRSESPAIVLTNSREEVREVVDAIEELIRTDTLSPTVGSVNSILSVLPANQEAKLEKIREIRQLVDDEATGVLSGEDERRINRLKEFLTVDQTFDWEDFPEKDRMRFTNAQGEPGNFVLIYPNVALRDGRNAMMFRDDVGTFTTASGKEFHAASSNIIVADMLSMIEKEGPIAVLLSLTVVFFIVAGNFRSFRAAIFVVAPLIVGLIWMGGAMWAFGWELNFFNVVVFPSLVGIGVDDGVHIYHRYREEGPGTLPFVMKRTGAAVFMTTITTIVGYSGLLMAHHPGLQSLGKLAALGLTMAFLTSVLLLPALLEMLDSRGGEEPEVATP